MRHSLLLLTAVLAGALGIGCSDQSGLTNADPGGINPYDGTLSNATERIEFEVPFTPSFSDGVISVFFGLGFDELPAVCAGAEPETLATVQVVTHPSSHGGTSEHVRVTASELNVIVFAVPGFPGIDPCDLGEPLAGGTVRIMLNDNEGSFFETAPGANPVILTAVGTVTNPETGQRYHLQARDHIIFFQDGTFKQLPGLFLELTPIGG